MRFSENFRDRNKENFPARLCYVYNSYLLKDQLWIYMLSYCFPGMERIKCTMAGFANGTIQATAWNTVQSVSIDWNFSQYSITYINHSSLRSLIRHVNHSFIAYIVHSSRISRVNHVHFSCTRASFIQYVHHSFITHNTH